VRTTWPVFVRRARLGRDIGMAKLKAGRLGRELTDACLQFWGGMGYMNETPVSRAYRDSRLTSIGGGADEVMLTVLCKMMGMLPGMNQKQ
jgi:citronellyl-CoA dehydrogenase